MVKNSTPNPDTSREREFKVILEDLYSQFRTFGEGQDDMRRDIKEMKAELRNVETRLTAVELQLHALDTRVQSLESRFDRCFHVLDDHESRLTDLEKAP